MLRSFVVALLSIVVLGATAVAQGVSIYAPVQPLYKLGDFDYRAPTVDGWRQVTSSESGFVLGHGVASCGHRSAASSGPSR